MAEMSGVALLPIFPLANVVLYPSVDCPLNIFEPRYRAMTRDALDSGGQIGMVVVLPEHVEEMSADPPIFDVGCAGTIHTAREFPDGRFHIVLHGTSRFRIESQPECAKDQQYRSARVRWLEDSHDPGASGATAPLRRRILNQLQSLARGRLPERAHRLIETRFVGLDDTAFTNGLCQLLDLRPREKQGLLEHDRILDRLKGLTELLEFRIAERSSGCTAGTSTLQ